jgi:nitrite reductase/ring-hydroxylating ferredoxin subunit
LQIQKLPAVKAAGSFFILCDILEKEFIKLCRLSDLPQKRGIRFVIDEENEVALFRIGDQVFAVDNVCPHNHVPEIFNGYVDEKNVSCPVHGFTFSLETGSQPTGFGCRLRTFSLKIEDGWILIERPEKSRFDFGAELYD